MKKDCYRAFLKVGNKRSTGVVEKSTMRVQCLDRDFTLKEIKKHGVIFVRWFTMWDD